MCNSQSLNQSRYSYRSIFWEAYFQPSNMPQAPGNGLTVERHVHPTGKVLGKTHRPHDW